MSNTYFTRSRHPVLSPSYPDLVGWTEPLWTLWTLWTSTAEESVISQLKKRPPQRLWYHEEIITILRNALAPFNVFPKLEPKNLFVVIIRECNVGPFVGMSRHKVNIMDFAGSRYKRNSFLTLDTALGNILKPKLVTNQILIISGGSFHHGRSEINLNVTTLKDSSPSQIFHFDQNDNGCPLDKFQPYGIEVDTSIFELHYYGRERRSTTLLKVTECIADAVMSKENITAPKFTSLFSDSESEHRPIIESSESFQSAINMSDSSSSYENPRDIEESVIVDTNVLNSQTPSKTAAPPSELETALLGYIENSLQSIEQLSQQLNNSTEGNSVSGLTYRTSPSSSGIDSSSSSASPSSPPSPLSPPLCLSSSSSSSSPPSAPSPPSPPSPPSVPSSQGSHCYSSASSNNESVGLN